MAQYKKTNIKRVQVVILRCLKSINNQNRREILLKSKNTKKPPEILIQNILKVLYKNHNSLLTEKNLRKIGKRANQRLRKENNPQYVYLTQKLKKISKEQKVFHRKQVISNNQGNRSPESNQTNTSQ